MTWENRHQNYSVVSVCEALRGSCTDNLVMTAPGGWLELEEAPLFTKDGRRFTMALSANGYKQVNVINRDTNQRVPITSGRMVVTNIYHWDEVNHEIYFKVAQRIHSSYFLTKMLPGHQGGFPRRETPLQGDRLPVRPAWPGHLPQL